jgi:hypothetical protein
MVLADTEALLCHVMAIVLILAVENIIFVAVSKHRERRSQTPIIKHCHLLHRGLSQRRRRQPATRSQPRGAGNSARGRYRGFAPQDLRTIRIFTSMSSSIHVTHGRQARHGSSRSSQPRSSSFREIRLRSTAPDINLADAIRLMASQIDAKE